MAMKLAIDNMEFIDDEVAQVVSSTALSLVDMGFTALQVKKSRAVLITVEADSIRYRFGTPTAANGHLIAASDGGWIVASPKSLDDLKVIRVTTDATVHVSLFG